MSTDEIEQLTFQIHERVYSIAQQMSPQQFKGWLSGTVASIVGNMADDYWEEFSKVEPCGVSGCDCHLGVVLDVTRLFTLLREDYKEHGPASQEITE